MAKLSKSFCFDLPHTLTSDIKDVSDLFQSPRVPVTNPKSQTKDLLLPLGERQKNIVHLLLEHAVGRRVRRRDSRIVFDEVTKSGIPLIPDRV